jgi:hypothetical protein
VLQSSEKYRLQTLTAPVHGTVQQLAVHTEGGVVTPAEAFLAIVPADSHLEIEAMISNRDIGFVHEGQEVAVKIDTFNFTKCGLLHGKVQTVSQDAIARDKAAGRLGQQTATLAPRMTAANPEARNSSTYTTASWRACNNSTSNRISFVDGLGTDFIFALQEEMIEAGTTAGLCWTRPAVPTKSTIRAAAISKIPERMKASR